MRRTTFYCFYATGEEAPADAPVTLEQHEVLTLLERLQEPGDFLGVVSPSGVTLQVMHEGDRGFWVEVPAPEQGGSWGKHCPRAGLRPLFEALPADFTHARFVPLGFTFLSWS